MVSHNARTREVRQRSVSSNRDFRARNNAAVNRERNVAVNRARNAEVNRDRNAAELRARKDLATNRERNVAINRARNVEVNRDRNSAAFRARNNLAVIAVETSRITEEEMLRLTITHSAAFAPTVCNLRNYHREWHDRGWWRSHYNRIVFVNAGWYYWNAGYWFRHGVMLRRLIMHSRPNLRHNGLALTG
jgi:hypothetical protein